MSVYCQIRTGASPSLILLVVSAWVGLAVVFPAYGQVSEAEHKSHHPSAGQAGPPEGVGGGPPEGAGGMMGGEMGGMMEKMGAPTPKDFYPTLMSLPELTPEKREEIQRQAGERMRSGAALWSTGLEQLTLASENEDYGAMQESLAQVREGLERFESGLAARRALAEGQVPRNMALQWFKQEMNLASPMPSDKPRSLLGATPFHLFSMVLLVMFALVMVALYFAKMRRAAALFGRIEASKGAPPPGSAPALAGTAPPPPAAKGERGAAT